MDSTNFKAGIILSEILHKIISISVPFFTKFTKYLPNFINQLDINLFTRFE